MSIKNIKGDLLSSNCAIRCQIVNCCGVADGGLAALVEEKYPEAAAIYKGLCNTFGAGLLGEVQLVPCHDGSVIANMFAQAEWDGNKSVTNIQALEKCFERILLLAAKTGLSFGFPKNLGAGYGRGDWEEISALMEGYFAHPSDNCFVVEYEEPPKPAEEVKPAEKPTPGLRKSSRSRPIPPRSLRKSTSRFARWESMRTAPADGPLFSGQGKPIRSWQGAPPSRRQKIWC